LRIDYNIIPLPFVPLVPFVLFGVIEMAKQTTTLVPVDALIFGGNPRDERNYNLPGMIDLIKRHGWQPDSTLMVSEKSDGQYLVLRGNRRAKSLQFLRDNEPGTYAEVLGGGKVPCIVYKGLTEAEETRLRIDHDPAADREPLDQWSQFLAIRQLVGIGEGQAEIATILGIFHTKGKTPGAPNRSYVQIRANLARLPQFVQSEMEKAVYSPKSTPMQWQKINGLFGVFGKEYANYPAGDGPLFRVAWDEVMSPKDKGDEATQTAKSLTPKQAVDRGQTARSEIVKRVLLAATGQGGETLTDCDDYAVSLEIAASALATLRRHVGDVEIDTLLQEAMEASKEVVNA